MTPLRTRHTPTSTILAYVLGAIVVALFVSYLIFQSRLLIEGPVVTLLDEPSIVQSSRTVTLSGIAKNIINISVNGRPIVTDERGHFSESVVLENGYTIVSIQAEDRYGRTTALERPFVYSPLSRLE